jgi:hypothetical protein
VVFNFVCCDYLLKQRKQLFHNNDFGYFYKAKVNRSLTQNRITLFKKEYHERFSSITKLVALAI